MARIRIGRRYIGNQCRPYIIAEAGINHNGEIEKAFAMIDLAKSVGADAVKFQTFKAEEFVGDGKLTYTYKSQDKLVTESMLTMFQRYEFGREDWYKIKKKCDDVDICFLSTPQNRSDLDLLLALGIPAVKVGSDDLTNLPLLKSYALTKLPLLISCGMSNMAEIYQALDSIGTLQGYPTILFVCTSQYPTPPKDSNLLRIKTLLNIFPKLYLGFSDHTTGSLAATVAVGLGAIAFEKHFTLDNDLPGPDHWFSANPIQLKNWVDSIRAANIMLGHGIVEPTKREMINKKEFQRVIVAAKDIKKGDIFTGESFVMLRISEGKGFPPMFVDYLLGKTSIRDIKKGEPI